MSIANTPTMVLDSGDLSRLLADWSGGGGRLHHLLARRLGDLAERGQLPAGARLPPERALAEVLGISRTTVVAAYRTLKADGRVAARQGSGTYVVPPGGPSRAEHPVIGALARNQLFAALGTDSSGTLDLATAIPPAAACVPDAFPAGDIRLACTGSGYVPAGSEQLREAIARSYRAQGLGTTADQILVTSGAQQAISLVAWLYLRPGDAVVVDQPTFPGALDAFRAVGARLLSMPVDAGGARIDVLERLVRGNAPHLVYVVATHQNPTGSVLTPPRRERLAAVAATGQIPVIDDTTLADLDHDGTAEPPVPVAAYAPDAPVVTIGSMSKLFWGGLRVGWVRAPEPVITRLRRLKTIADLGSPVLEQAWAARLLEQVDHARAERRAQLSHRREVLESTLAALLPSWRWAAPTGGLSLWVQVPGDTRALAASALRNGVSVVPGPQFCADEGCADHLRLPFTQEPDVLVEGVRRLARTWDDHQPGLLSGTSAVVV